MVVLLKKGDLGLLTAHAMNMQYRTFNKILALVDINYYNYGTLTLKFIKFYVEKNSISS